MKRKGTPRRCQRCFARVKSPVRKCCGWATCEPCTDSGMVDADRGFPLCKACVRFRKQLAASGHRDGQPTWRPAGAA